MPKTICFLSSFFANLGLDFGAPCASKMEPSPPRCLQRQACQTPLHFMLALTYCISLLGGSREVPRPRGVLGHVGVMLALFSLLGAFFSLLDASYALFGHFWPIVFFGFLVALDSMLQALGQVLEPSNLHFSIFLVLASTNHRSALHATKPQFLRCFIDFGTCRTQLPNVFFV